jgi:hypothetical protein
MRGVGTDATLAAALSARRVFRRARSSDGVREHTPDSNLGVCSGDTQDGFASLALICATSAAIVLMLLMEATTKFHGF